MRIDIIMKFLKQEKYSDIIDTEYLISETVSDTEIKRKIFWTREFLSTGNKTEGTRIETRQKFLCVNGPLVGQKITEDAGEEHGYRRFNAARNDGKVRNILVQID